VKADLRDLAGIPESRLLLVYPADSRLETLKPTPIAGLEKPFFLAVSMTNPRKNLAPLLKAFSRFNGEGRPYRLALTGNPAWIAAQIAASGCADAVNLGFVEDRELAWLYREAEALAYPSLDEGFGIPLVDASRFGCPVLCSDLPVFREVMGDHAFYFDAKSPDSIAEALDSARRRGRAGEAPDIARRFTWEASALALVDGIKTAGG
jgi:glycosyltransferase involved in cell wall biosynthesis